MSTHMSTSCHSEILAIRRVETLAANQVPKTIQVRTLMHNDMGEYTGKEKNRVMQTARGDLSCAKSAHVLLHSNMNQAHK